MSRIIVSRHTNGEEKLVAGFDRPLSYFFVDEYDEKGRAVGGIGMLRDQKCPSPSAAQDFLLGKGVDIATAYKVRGLLEAHSYLEYPESNVTVDLKARERVERR